MREMLPSAWGNWATIKKRGGGEFDSKICLHTEAGVETRSHLRVRQRETELNLSLTKIPARMTVQAQYTI